jgi:hypothetical protein
VRDGGAILHVVWSQDLLKGLGGLLGMVKWHLGEEVVAHVGVHNVVEGTVQEGSERSVHSAQCTTQPRPLLVSKVGHVDVSVLQESDEHQVIVDHHVGQKVVATHIGKTCKNRLKSIIKKESTRPRLTESEN